MAVTSMSHIYISGVADKPVSVHSESGTSELQVTQWWNSIVKLL